MKETALRMGGEINESSPLPQHRQLFEKVASGLSITRGRKRFSDFEEVDQQKLILLSSWIGLTATDKINSRWNSFGWREVWGEIYEENKDFIDINKPAGSQGLLMWGFKNFFDMSQARVNSIQELHDLKLKGRKVITESGGKTNHTSQNPASNRSGLYHS